MPFKKLNALDYKSDVDLFCSYSIAATMPRPSINLDPFWHEIECRVAAGDSQTQIRQWLVTQGVSISKNIFFS